MPEVSDGGLLEETGRPARDEANAHERDEVGADQEPLGVDLDVLQTETAPYAEKPRPQNSLTTPDVRVETPEVWPVWLGPKE